MMTASPRVYLLMEFSSFMAGATAHKDARGAMLVHLAVDENKSLGTVSQFHAWAWSEGKVPLTRRCRKGKF